MGKGKSSKKPSKKERERISQLIGKPYTKKYVYDGVVFSRRPKRKK